MMKKTAFVTGANKGIGFEITKSLLINGYHVLLGARNEERGTAAVKELSKFGHVELQLIDVTDFDSIHKAVANIKENHSDLSLLVNNAGVPGAWGKIAWDFEAQELMDTYMLNFIGPFELTKGLLQLLNDNKGKIVNISIPIKATDFFHPFAYQSSKAPLNVMIDNFGLEITNNNMDVQILGILPGAVSTDLNNHIQGDFVRTAEEAGKQIVAVAMDNKNHNGEIITIDYSK